MLLRSGDDSDNVAVISEFINIYKHYHTLLSATKRGSRAAVITPRHFRSARKYYVCVTVYSKCSYCLQQKVDEDRRLQQEMLKQKQEQVACFCCHL